MAGAEFELDPEGLGEVLAQAELVLRPIGNAIVEEAKRMPRNPRHRSHEVDLIAVGEFRVTDTGAELDINWDSSFWHLVEYGSVNSPPYRPLTRAAQNAGLTIDDRGPR